MKRHQVLLSLVCVVIFVFLAVGSDGNDDEPIQEVEEETLQDKEELEQEVLNILRESFGDVGEIELTDETFIIIPTDPSLGAELLAAYDGDPSALAEWEILVEEMKGLSSNMEPILPGYWIDLRNPENPENSILVVEDGVVIYDFIND